MKLNKLMTALALTFAVGVSGGCGTAAPQAGAPEAAAPAAVETQEKPAEEPKVTEEAAPETAEETEAEPDAEDAGYVPTEQTLPELMLSRAHYYEMSEKEPIVLLFEGKCGYLKLTADSALKYPELAESLSQDSEGRMKAFASEAEKAVGEAEEMLGENPGMFEGMNYYADNIEYVQRLDNKVLSITENCNNFMGGAHGGYWLTGISFDVRTGKRLNLTDVLKNTDNLKAILKAELLENYDEEMFYGLDESLDQYDPLMTGEEFQETADGDLRFPYNWYFTDSGLEFYFAPYDLAPYAVGAQTVTLSYGDNVEFFNEDYLPGDTGGYMRSFPGAMGGIDINGDGITDELSVYYEMNEDNTEATGIRVDINAYREPEDCGGFQPTFTMKSDELLWDSELQNYYAVTDDGRQYLYTFAPTYNDWQVLYVFDLNGGTVKSAGSEWYRGCSFPDDEDYAEAVYTDPDRILLASSFDLLQTFSGIRMYHIGADGMPESDEIFYENPYVGEGNYPLTLKTEVGCGILSPDGEIEKEETLPAGTEFAVFRTDGESVLDVLLSDGRVARLEITDAGYPCKIGGIVDADLVETCLYAG